MGRLHKNRANAKNDHEPPAPSVEATMTDDPLSADAAEKHEPATKSTAFIPNILVVTDIGNDYDDFMALLILGYFHKLGKIKIKAIIVTGEPTEKRCQLTRGLLVKCMGITNIKIACGSPHVKIKTLPDWQHEALHPSFASEAHVVCQSHLVVAREVLEEARTNGEKIRLLSIACLRDTWHIIQQDRTLFTEVVEQVHVQGGCKFDTKAKLLDPEKEDIANSTSEREEVESFYHSTDGPTERFLAPRNDAKNNRDDMKSARDFFKFIQEGRIPCTVYTKQAAFASKFKKDVFDSNIASPKMKPVADYLYIIHDVQKRAYYDDAVDPERRHQPYMDTSWFIDGNTRDLPQNLLERLRAQESDTTQRVDFDEIMPYTMVLSYDPIAALGCIQDVTGFKVKKDQIGTSSLKVASVGSNMEGKDGEVLAQKIHDHLVAAMRWLLENCHIQHNPHSIVELPETVQLVEYIESITGNPVKKENSVDVPESDRNLAKASQRVPLAVLKINE